MPTPKTDNAAEPLKWLGGTSFSNNYRKPIKRSVAGRR